MLRASHCDANEVAPGIYVGSRPDYEECRSYEVIVFAAKEYQPSATDFPGIKIIHAPMDDTDPMSKEDTTTALRTAMTVAALRRKGNRVLVTCWAGLNRSGLIAALALKLLYKTNATQAIQRVRNARGPWAISNNAFVRLIGATPHG